MVEGREKREKFSKIARFYFEIVADVITFISCRMLNTIKERNEMTRSLNSWLFGD